jgi:hypothetical protein
MSAVHHECRHGQGDPEDPVAAGWLVDTSAGEHDRPVVLIQRQAETDRLSAAYAFDLELDTLRRAFICSNTPSEQEL